MADEATAAAIGEAATKLGNLLDSLQMCRFSGIVEPDKMDLLEALDVEEVGVFFSVEQSCAGFAKQARIQITVNREDLRDNFFVPILDAYGVDPEYVDLDEFLETDFSQQHPGNEVWFDEDEFGEYYTIVRRMNRS